METIKYVVKLGKAYLSFYKTGLKNVWSNYKEYRKIKARLGRYNLQDAVKYCHPDIEPGITRREYQLYLRTERDLKKLLPFGLTLLICGELTPLVVLGLKLPVVPETCKFPQQVERARHKALKRALQIRDDVKRDTEANSEATCPDLVLGRSKEGLTHAHISDLCVRSTASLWGWSLLYRVYTTSPIFMRHMISSWLMNRFKAYGEEILCDLILIHREGGVRCLESAEILLLADRLCLYEYVSGACFSRARQCETGDVDSEAAKYLMPELEERVERALHLLKLVGLAPNLHWVSILGAINSPSHLQDWPKKDTSPSQS